jgi:hypothetical protein
MFNGKMKSSLTGYVTGVGRAVGNLQKPKTAYMMPPKNSQNREGNGTVKKTAPVTPKPATALPTPRGRKSLKSFGRLGTT